MILAEEDKAIDQTPWFILGGIGAILLLILLLFLGKNKNKGDLKAPSYSQPSVPKPAPVTALPTVASAAPDVTPQARNPSPGKHTIAVTRRGKVKPVSKEVRQFPVIDHRYRSYNMGHLWEQSSVGMVHVHEQVIDDIHAFVPSEGSTGRNAIDGSQEAVEVAGFLMGMKNRRPGMQQFTLAIEKFIPISTGERSLYRVELDAEAWLVVDNIREENPGFALLGWFHTHPGHRLFLSQPDLNIQNQLFKERYQVAIELDPLSANRDLGIFSRRPTGGMNNARVRKPGGWFRWPKPFH